MLKELDDFAMLWYNSSWKVGKIVMRIWVVKLGVSLLKDKFFMVLHGLDGLYSYFRWHWIMDMNKGG